MSANPFWVLGLGPAATRQEVERAAQKLLAQLALNLASASTVETPAGPLPRTADDVRAAAAALRDPEQRIVAELLADPLPPQPAPLPSQGVDLYGALRLLAP